MQAGKFAHEFGEVPDGVGCLIVGVRGRLCSPLQRCTIAHERPGGTVVVTHTDVYWDPYDVEINTDPYPVFKRLREEAPLYYNEQYEFYAVSRFPTSSVPARS